MGRVRHAFARYPRRAVLDGCPHCRGPVRVDEHNLFSLSLSLGNTVGDRDDVKSLLPLLFERLVTSSELDPGIVFSKLPQEQWRTWPEAEQEAVDGYLDTVWRSLLAAYPSRLGSFPNATSFLDAATNIGEGVERYLDIWTATHGSAADRHLADAVNGLNFAASTSSTLATWLRSGTVRGRLYRAFERQHDSTWADDLARAYDLLRG